MNVYSLGHRVAVAHEVVAGDITFYLRLLSFVFFYMYSFFLLIFPFCYASPLSKPFIIDLICMFGIC